MGDLVDFQQFKERKQIQQIEFVTPKHESYCPFCKAPTLITKTLGGSDIHKFDPSNKEDYEKLRLLLLAIVNYFRTTAEGVDDADLIEAFGEGMKEFLKEMEDES